MQTIHSSELAKLLRSDYPPLLIDVREDWERAHFNIGGLHIPVSEIFERIDEIPADIPVVLYCRKGIRSMMVIQRLVNNYHNLINLSGGMDAWQNEIVSGS